MLCRLLRPFQVAAAKEPLPNRPQDFDTTFINRMVLDELEELADAKTVADKADALADIIVYCANEAIKHGIDLDRIIEIVHEANMTKVKDGKVTRDPNTGKILKPEGFQPPDVEGEILRQSVGINPGTFVELHDDEGETMLVLGYSGGGQYDCVYTDDSNLTLSHAEEDLKVVTDEQVYERLSASPD